MGLTIFKFIICICVYVENLEDVGHVEDHGADTSPLSEKVKHLGVWEISRLKYLVSFFRVKLKGQYWHQKDKYWCIGTKRSNNMYIGTRNDIDKKPTKSKNEILQWKVNLIIWFAPLHKREGGERLGWEGDLRQTSMLKIFSSINFQCSK